jgi:hypothetical protein
MSEGRVGTSSAEISRERALVLIGVYLSRDFIAELAGGWPQGAYVVSEEPVWSAGIPSDQPRVGGARFIVISRLTGKILADQVLGE